MNSIQQKLFVKTIQGYKSGKIPKNVAKKLLNKLKETDRKPNLAEATSDIGGIGREPPYNDDVAIVGMSGQFPRARDINEFWQNLVEGKDCISEIPSDRWDWQAYYGNPHKETNKTNIKWGGFIDGVGDFDPLFFGISPREAELMDPQQRLLMIHVWKTIEDAGYSPSALSGTKTAIFVGTAGSGYSGLISQENTPIEGYSSTGIVPSVGPNRMSFFLNLHGPSEPIETACSSSLIALHRAVVSIKNGDCDMAIAGGVNTILAPEVYISFNKAGMLCEDGRCKTFSNQANGYVRGEGIGILFLKKLKAAKQAKDHIYGVIRASAENHGGRANSLTAPNPKAQADLLRMAYRKARIDPRSVGYIEAHGTGTELGDPIEINGLKMAFKALCGEQSDEGWTPSARQDSIRHHHQDNGKSTIQNERYCGIGSVKTNIGHLELAAGIAGVIKVLLQLKHKTLVKSLHCHEINPYIQLNNSPFYIVQETKEWQALHDAQGKELPRRAGVSSFGFGGANAHIVIEEYLKEKSEIRNPKSETIGSDSENLKSQITNLKLHLIVLSAKNEDRLRESAKNLSVYLTENREPGTVNLSDLAYTLQVGREAMEERLAVMVRSITELVEKLQAFLERKDDIEDLYYGVVNRNKKSLAVFMADDDMERTIEAWIEKGKYAKILDVWTKGLTIDWHKLYRESKPRRISLPTYPFLNERYWIPEYSTIQHPASSIQHPASKLHPLVHENTSNFEEQRFSSTFTGQEFFFLDNQIKGQKVLPSMVYLEMVRFAIEQANGADIENQLLSIRLKDVVWFNSLVIENESVQVHIGLFPEHNGEISFYIYSQSEFKEIEPIVYMQGRAILDSTLFAPNLDISVLKQTSSQRLLAAERHYEAIEAINVYSGANLGQNEQIFAEGNKVWVKLSILDSNSTTQDPPPLLPSLLGSALQASTKLVNMNWQLNQPLAMREIEILRLCTSNAWALIRSKNVHTANNYHFLDIDLYDDQGRACIRLKGLELRENVGTNTESSFNNSSSNGSNKKTNEPFELMTFEEIWNEQTLSSDSNIKMKTLVCFLSNPDNQQAVVKTLKQCSPQTTPVFISQGKYCDKDSDQKYSVCRTEKNTFREVFTKIREVYDNVDGVLYLWALEDPSCLQDFSCMVHSLQAIEFAGIKPKRVLLAGEYCTGLDRCYIESWIGFERSIGLVMPNTLLSVVYQAAGPQNQKQAMQEWMLRLWTELHSAHAQNVLIREGRRTVSQIQRMTMQSSNSHLKSGGTYLITGGCGGLGLLFAEHLAKTYNANLVLNGRSPMDAGKKSKIKLLEDLGCQVMYVEANVCDPTGMRRVLNRAKKRFGKIHGVIHAAGVVGHQSILEKEMEDFQKVLAPKVKGTLTLAEALKDEALDFVCYLSSSSAILGDFGSCDYAIGNRFQMAYANHRHHQYLSGKRPEKSIVINWPVWKEGGMSFGEDKNTQMYLKSSGQRFLETEEGIALFERLLSHANPQHLVLVAQPSRANRFLTQTVGCPEPDSLGETVININSQVSPDPNSRKKR